MLVAGLTQWILGRRARTELLTKKLEELYLALNYISARNLKRVEEALPLAVASPFDRPNVSGGSTERQGLDLHRRIIMLVRLYFPRLGAAHQDVFRRNSAVKTLICEAEAGPPLFEERLLALSGAYRDAFVAMEEEVIKNRRILVNDGLLPMRYRRIPARVSSTPVPHET